MYYALIDWDQTIRRHYTIYDLGAYLQRAGFVSEALLQQFRELEMGYLRHAIPYEVYTERTCEAFAHSLDGCSVASYEQHILAYLADDNRAIYPNASALFQLLDRYGIAAYVVSGAPYDVLKHYGERFKLQGIFAFELEARNGTFTGSVKGNYGLNKQRILQHPRFLAADAIHMVGMGDAVADIPLLDNSRIPIIAGSKPLSLRAGSQPLVFAAAHWDLQALEQRLQSLLD